MLRSWNKHVFWLIKWFYMISACTIIFQFCTTVQKWGLLVFENIFVMPTHLHKFAGYQILDNKFSFFNNLKTFLKVSYCNHDCCWRNLMTIWYLFLCSWSVLISKPREFLPFIFLHVTKMCLTVSVFFKIHILFLNHVMKA